MRVFILAFADLDFTLLQMLPDSSSPTSSKRELRRSVRAALRSRVAEEIDGLSRDLLKHLMRKDGWSAGSGTVAMFGGLPGEPDLLPLLPWLHERGARAVFFAVRGDELVAYEVRSRDDLRRGMLGVWEPVDDPARQVNAADITAVLTPGLAFGRLDGSRLGRGAGFYDRFFAQPESTALRVGVAFDCQIMDRVPVESHDARVDEIVTESGWIRF